MDLLFYAEHLTEATKCGGLGATAVKNLLAVYIQSLVENENPVVATKVSGQRNSARQSNEP